MHRSGTSAFTRVCNLLGGALPQPLVEPAVGNELGHWEPAEVVAMNDRVLMEADNDVNSIFPLSARWSRSKAALDFTGEVADYISGLGGPGRTWFVKDPRISILADLWLAGVEKAGSRPRFVIAFRNPWEVATSLAARQLHHFPDEVWPLERGLAIWLRYVLTAERQSRGHPRSFIGFESFLGNWEPEIGRVYRQLGLVQPTPEPSARAAIEAFLQPDRRRARHETLQTHAGLAMLVYDLLLARSEDPDGDRAAFDKAYRAYVDSFDVFGGYMHALETRAKAFAPLRSIAEHERQAAAEQKASAEAADRRLALTVRRLADVEAAAPEGTDADRTLRRLEAKHEALKAAHRENLKVYAAQGAAFAAELAAVKEEAAVQLTNEIREGRLAYEELRREAGEAKDRLAAAEPDVEKAAALESEMEEARAAYEELRLEAARTRERLSELERVHAVVLHEFHIARRDLDVIHRSRSWRMTAPLRSASKRLGPH